VGVTVGIDLGATSVGVTVCSAHTDFLGSRTAVMDVRDGAGSVLATVVQMIDALLEEQGLTRAAVSGIGMLVPGLAEIATGLLISPPLMPTWEGFGLREFCADFFNAPVLIGNDVNLMALGELHHARVTQLTAGQENFIVVTLGTGIGAGVVAHGEVFRGADGAAGDIGHICVDQNGPRYHCGNAGSLEALAGGPGIVLEALAAAGRDERPLIMALGERGERLSVEEIGLAARHIEVAANRIIQQAGNRIGQVLARLVNFMNPFHVLIGGGLAHTDPLLASIRQRIYARSLPLSTRKLHIEYTRLGEAAGLRGAAVLAAYSSILWGEVR
jgi:predicted NBD/HSP70 family sugar kinase